MNIPESHHETDPEKASPTLWGIYPCPRAPAARGQAAAARAAAAKILAPICPERSGKRILQRISKKALCIHIL